MILHDAYDTLKRLGLVANHMSFSTDYLNKGPRYFDDLTCSRRAPSVAALLSLFVRFRAIADACTANPSLAAQASEVAAQASKVWVELERRSCSLLPTKRRRPAPIRVVEGSGAASGS